MPQREASSDDQIVRERMGLRVIRILTDLLVLELFSAALGLVFDLPAGSLVLCGLLMVCLALLSDQLQHRVKNIGPYTAWCTGLFFFVTICAGLISPLVWKFFGLECLLQIPAPYRGRAMEHYVFIPSIVHLLFPVCIYFLGVFTEGAGLKALAVGGEILFILLYLAWLNQKSLERTYVGASERTRVPYRKIGALNGGLLAVYLGLAGLICLVLTAIYSGDELLMALPLAAFRLAALVLYGIVRLFALLFPSAGDGGGTGGGEGGPMMPEGEPLFPWMHLVWFVLERVFGILFLLLLAYSCYRALYDFYYDFRAADPETGDTRKRTQTREKLQRIKRPRLSVLDFSPAARIRREYRRFLLKQPGREEIEKSHTPAQLEEVAGGPGAAGRENWKTIHRIYEKARYGPGQVTARDLALMREAIRKDQE